MESLIQQTDAVPNMFHYPEYIKFILVTEKTMWYPNTTSFFKRWSAWWEFFVNFSYYVQYDENYGWVRMGETGVTNYYLPFLVKIDLSRAAAAATTQRRTTKTTPRSIWSENK